MSRYFSEQIFRNNNDYFSVRKENKMTCSIHFLNMLNTFKIVCDKLKKIQSLKFNARYLFSLFFMPLDYVGVWLT